MTTPRKTTTTTKMAVLLLLGLACSPPEAGQVSLVILYGQGVQLPAVDGPYTLTVSVQRKGEEIAGASAELGTAANLVLDDIAVDPRLTASASVTDAAGVVRLSGSTGEFSLTADVVVAVPLLLVDLEGWSCVGSTCAPVCGDALLRGDETCDDGGAVDGDGCSAACRNEAGFVCGGDICVVVPEVEVPAGVFNIGCDPNAADCETSASGHPVFVDAFFVDATEVTVEQFSQCASVGRCRPAGTGGECNSGRAGFDRHPQNCVDWVQATDFCAFAGKTLCTEAQWEKAARGTDGRLYPWGNEPPTCEYAVMRETEAFGCGAISCTQPVGSRPLDGSPNGALDLVGNVSEWVQDCYEESYIGAPLDGSARTSCPVSGSGIHVVRGDSCAAQAEGLGGLETLTARARNFAAEHDVKTINGLRCCRAVP